MKREYNGSYPQWWAAIALGWVLQSISVGPTQAALSPAPIAIAQAPSALCPSPVLERLRTHTVAAGETLENIAAQYNLMPLTLLALNPAIQGNTVSPGTRLRIPPFNGIEVAVTAGQTWEGLATQYRVRADVLFEINGCPATLPSRVFIPGVGGLLEGNRPSTAAATNADPLTGYPLAAPGAIVANYGWQTDAEREELIFSSGITLETAQGVAVQAVGTGTVAYVGDQNGQGTLIVINHAQGFQTRYASITEPQVKAGDSVRADQVLATALPIADGKANLYFEVRLNSSLGWVARDPGDFIPELAVK